MLKPSDPASAPGGAEDERPVSELVHRLVEDGKSYALAEIGLARAIAARKAALLALPAAVLGIALLLAIAGTSALAVGIMLAIAPLTGPLAAGLLAFLLFAAIAGGLGWWAIRRARLEP